MIHHQNHLNNHYSFEMIILNLILPNSDLNSFEIIAKSNILLVQVHQIECLKVVCSRYHENCQQLRDLDFLVEKSE